MGIQVEIAASQVDKGRLGYAAVSLTHFTDTAEPSIAAGSKVEVGGALYEFTADEAGTGYGAIGASNVAYILLTPAGATISWSYTTTEPTFSTSKQGWYTGDNRVIGGLYKDAGGNYMGKWLHGGGQHTKKTLAIGDWNMDSTGGPVTVAHGLVLSKIRAVTIMIINDAGTELFPIHGNRVDNYVDGSFKITATNISMNRNAGLGFDSTDFDATSYNRGWITIEYEA